MTVQKYNTFNKINKEHNEQIMINYYMLSKYKCCATEDDRK